MNSTPASRLERVRAAFGLSKKELADRVGVHASFISNIVSGNRPLSANIARQVEAELHISAEWLLEGIGAIEVSGHDLPPNVARRLSDYAASSSSSISQGPGEFPTLPLFGSPVDGHPLDFLHMTRGLRRTTARDLWWPSRYWLRVPESLPRPADVRAGELLLVETAIGDWESLGRCTGLLGVQDKCALVETILTDVRAGTASLKPRAAVPSIPLASSRRGERRYGLLGIVLLLQRDLWPEALLAGRAAQSSSSSYSGGTRRGDESS